jgi:hypothetical protein
MVSIRARGTGTVPMLKKQGNKKHARGSGFMEGEKYCVEGTCGIWYIVLGPKKG